MQPDVLIPMTSIGAGSWNNQFHLGFSVAPGQLIFHRNRSSGSVFNLQYSNNYFVTMGHFYGKDGGVEDIQDVEVDFVLRRRYAPVEPNYMIGAEQNL
jgi:hypothetical protein